MSFPGAFTDLEVSCSSHILGKKNQCSVSIHILILSWRGNNLLVILANLKFTSNFQETELRSTILFPLQFLSKLFLKEILQIIPEHYFITQTNASTISTKAAVNNYSQGHEPWALGHSQIHQSPFYYFPLWLQKGQRKLREAILGMFNT